MLTVLASTQHRSEAVCRTKHGRRPTRKRPNLYPNLTLVEKVNLTTGTGLNMGRCAGNTGAIPRLNFTSLCLQNGPSGVGQTDRVTQFPSGLAAGATWNRAYFRQRGEAMGIEAAIKGVDILLGPVAGPIGYKALGGRNFEAFGSDPYLAGVAAGNTVSGIQSKGVMANAKHWIGNEQEHYRRVEEARLFMMDNIDYPISSNIDDRTMHEVFSWPFADMIRAGVGSVMTSCNSVNNSQASQNAYILNNLLKDQLGFEGFVMTDWGTHDSGVASSLAGLDMSMPGNIATSVFEKDPLWGRELTKSVLNGTVPEWRLNDMVTRIMAAYYLVGLDHKRHQVNFHSGYPDSFGPEYPGGPTNKYNDHVNTQKTFSRQVAVKGAVESFVLLKNSNATLPLRGDKKPGSVGILGLGAAPLPYNSGNMGLDTEGALSAGWGSSFVTPPHVTSPYEALNARAALESISVRYDFEAEPAEDFIRFPAAARGNDVNLIFVLASSGETLPVDSNYGDRNNASLWYKGDELIEEACKLNTNNVVVVTATGPVNMERWINNENVTAVLYNPPNGQAFGTAVTEVLFGDENPSGRLPFTIARNDSDYVPVIMHNNKAGTHNTIQDNYDRGLLIDYRYFDQYNITPRYAFGHGLSYSNFTMSDLNVETIHRPVRQINQVTYQPNSSVSHLHYNTEELNASDALFPRKFHQVPGWAYPYLNDSSEGDPQKPYPYPEGYSNVQQPLPARVGGDVGGNPDLWEVVYRVKVDVHNMGPYSGKFVPQLYMGFPNSTKFPSPKRQLRGFEKVKLAAGSSKIVSFDLTTRDISVWDTRQQLWVVQKGVYNVFVGYSALDTPFNTTFHV